jgi:hypothetical protein
MAENHDGLDKRPTQAVPNSLSGQDVVNEGGKIAKDVLRTSAVWTLSGFLTQAIRGVLKKVTK